MSIEGEVDALEELVGRTRGAQPWRKLFHATNGLVLAAALTFLPLGRSMTLAALGMILLLLITLDLVRLRSREANELFFKVFSSLASPREERGLASSTWYTLGVLLAVAFFDRHTAVSGVLVLGLADPAASYLGQRRGTTPFMGGTVLGSSTFFAVALGVLAFRHSLPVALIAAAAVTVAERRSWPLDDNLTIPVACAGVLAATSLVL